MEETIKSTTLKHSQLATFNLLTVFTLQQSRRNSYRKGHKDSKKSIKENLYLSRKKSNLIARALISHWVPGHNKGIKAKRFLFSNIVTLISCSVSTYD